MCKQQTIYNQGTKILWMLKQDIIPCNTDNKGCSHYPPLPLCPTPPNSHHRKPHREKTSRRTKGATLWRVNRNTERDWLSKQMDPHLSLIDHLKLSMWFTLYWIGPRWNVFKPQLSRGLTLITEQLNFPLGECHRYYLWVSWQCPVSLIWKKLFRDYEKNQRIRTSFFCCLITSVWNLPKTNNSSLPLPLFITLRA